MTRASVSLLILLVLVVWIALHLHRRAEQMRAWAIVVPEQIPDRDPRLDAAAMGTRVTAARRQLHSQLRLAGELITIPKTEMEIAAETSRGEPNAGPKLTTEEVDRRVSKLLSQAIGAEEAAELRTLIDPKRHPLPDRVLLYRDDTPAWLPVRAQWSEPMGQRELSYVSRHGHPPELINQLNPKIPLHVNCVLSALHSHGIDAQLAVRFLKNRPPAKFNRTHRPTYYGLVNLSQQGIAGEEELLKYFTAWSHAKPREDQLDDPTLSLISQLNLPKLWTHISLQAGLGRTSRPILDRLQAHAIWHRARIDAASEDVLKRLRSNQSFPDTALAVDPNYEVATEDQLEPALEDDLFDTISTWQKQLVLATPQEQHELYRQLLKIEPDDRLRSQVLAFAGSFRPANAATESLAAALYCRWATPQDIAPLFRHATTTQRQRSSPDEPDATAEAILTICRERSAIAVDVAKFWLDQPRWPRPVSTAWSSSGQVAELAFCETLLGSDLRHPPPGIQQSLQVLATIGDTTTLTTLDAIESHNATNKVEVPNLDRFMRFCRSRIDRRCASRNEGGQK